MEVTGRLERSQSDHTALSSSRPDLVHTAGGKLHYVKKQVAYGLHGVIEEELSPPPRASEEIILKTETRRSLRRKNSRSRSEGNLALCGTADQQSLLQNLPAHGDLRHVYLDMTWTRFGFRLQSYGRRSEEVKTVVQTVTAGSPAFMAGLHPGDVILEVNGADVSASSINDIVSAIMSTKEKRVQLLVKYVNGAHYLELKKKMQVAQESLKEKQKRLMELLSANNCPLSFLPSTISLKKAKYYSLPFQYLLDALHDTLTTDYKSMPQLTTTTPHSTSEQLTNGHISCCDENNRLVVSKLAIYTNEIHQISCDAIILPFDSVDRRRRSASPPQEGEGEEESCHNIGLVTKFIQKGSDKLINELSLAKQCHLGEVMMTTAGELKTIKNLFHCVIGHFEEHIRLCSIMALEKCLTKELSTITFWLDGFISCNVPPTLFLETVKRVLREKSDLLHSFKAIVFASQSVPNLAELLADIFTQ